MASILTFYSYKGGVGRTMAVANIAVLLAQQGLRVLAVDWDLEAPGLHQYFANLKITNAKLGLLDLFLDATKMSKTRPDWQSYVSTVTIDSSTQLRLLTAGKFDEGYEKEVLQFNWNHFFKNQNGGAFLEALRRQWIESFDVVLIDSRTGITDSGGVCTVQMPDILVPVFSANRQSLEGTKQVILRAQQARQEFAYDRTRLLIFPLISRFDSRTEYAESQTWLKLFAEELKDFYHDWLPKDTRVLQILERTKLPYVAFFSFGEKLPVITEGTTDPESLGFAYQNAATLIANNFVDADRLLSPPSQRQSQENNASRYQIRWKIHQDVTIPKLEDIKDYGFVGIYCSPLDSVSIDVADLKQFLNLNRLQFAEEMHYFPRFDVFQNGISVGYFPNAVRSDIKSTHRITLYTDGRVALDAQADVLMNKDHKLHLGWFTYELQRHLQLTKALLKTHTSLIQVSIDFENIEQFSLMFAGLMSFGATSPYSGYHESLSRRLRLSEIYDHDGPQRNIVMPIVQDVVAEVCRIFGLDRVPSGIWNESGKLLYVMGLEGSR
jgi:MinD-like ATPase involved in chromosome partitioning or flagellar assembly